MEEGGRSPTYRDEAEPSADSVALDQQVEPVPTSSGESLAATIAALADPATRSPKPDTCPFLRTIDASGSAAPPIEAVDGTNRCVAVGEPAPQSARQQQLVCLTTGHINCPRYLRGALVAGDTPAAASPRKTPSTPVIASALLLIAAASMSVGFLLVRGGFDLPVSLAGRVPDCRCDDRVAAADAVPGCIGPGAEHSAGHRTARGITDPDARADGATRDRDTARGDPAADPGPFERPLRPPRGVPGRAGVLGLLRPAGRQSGQHRQLLRSSVRHRARHEPAGR